MKKNIFIILVNLILAMNVIAADVQIVVEPPEPLINEAFNVIFTVESNTSEEPYISFDPGRAEVTGRNKLGTSVQTTIINGKISTKRVTKYSYEMITDKSGQLSLRNIKAEVDGDEYKLRTYKIKVLKKRRKPKELFVLAEPSKKLLFVGEGFDINYYLYFRINVVAKEILEYPKLQKLLKRFKVVNEKIETVEHNGVVYRRVLVYSARAFSDKVGKVTIDPIKVRAQYQSSRRSSRGFGGLSFGGYKTKTLRSKRVKLEVIALPAENVPTNFSGLIGKHDFKLIVNRTKFLVNEAIEATLTVSGEGALENYEAPKIYENDNLEDFDTKAELTGLERGKPVKTFEYTILARGPVSIAARKLNISYFDPEAKTYKKQIIQIPSILVGGTASAGKSSQVTTPSVATPNSSPAPVVKQEMLRGLLAPEFTQSVVNLRSNWPMYLNYILGFFIIGLIFSMAFSMRRPQDEHLSFDEQFILIKKQGLNYSNIFKILNNLNGNKEQSLSIRINQSELSNESKHYFENLLLMAEQSQYKDKSKLTMKIKAKEFKELITYLKRSFDENHK